MKKLFCSFSVIVPLLFIFFLSPNQIFAQTQASPVSSGSAAPATDSTPPIPAAPTQSYYRAKITGIVSETQIPNGSTSLYTQVLQVEREDNHQQLQINAGSDVQPLSDSQRYQVGTEVIITQQQITPTQQEWVIFDTYRLTGMAVLAFGFFALVLIIAHRQGVFSIVGMFLSLAVLMFFIVPQIIAGQNPVIISLLGSGVVSIVTIYLCYGFRTESHVALASIFLTLIAVGLLSFGAVHMVHLAGLGSEDAMYLQFGTTDKVNLQGLLLAGIMIGALGVLNDIVVAQVLVVDQFRETKPDITFSELYNRSLAIGKNHVASLVYTLVLAYAASSLPLFLLFSTYTAQPAWVTLNSEIIAEEVVRTLTGSIALVLAVPLTTVIASYFAMKKNAKDYDKTMRQQMHSHIH